MSTKPIEVRPESSTLWIKGLAHADRMRMTTNLYDALRDWLERHRLVDVGLLPSGVLRPATVDGRTALAVRGVPVGRLTSDSLELFLPPYVQGATALEAARELVRVIRKRGLAKDAVINPGEHRGQHAA